MSWRGVFGKAVSPEDLILMAEDSLFGSGPRGDRDAAAAIRVAARGNTRLLKKASYVFVAGAGELRPFDVLQAHVRLRLAVDPSFALPAQEAERYARESRIASVCEAACRSAMDGTWVDPDTPGHLRAAAGEDLDVVRAALGQISGGDDPDQQVGGALIDVAIGEPDQRSVAAVAERCQLSAHSEFIHTNRTSRQGSLRILLSELHGSIGG